LLNFLPKHKFNQFVGQHGSDRYTKRLTTWNQLVALIYAQATGKDSLREIETGLNLNKNIWYHLGVGSVARSSLADANSRRSYQIFEKLFYSLLSQCQEIIPTEDKFDFKNPLYSFDSTTVELCLSLFNWAKFRTTKGALKIHTLLNNRTTIPELLNITTGKVADVTALKNMNLELPPDSIIGPILTMIYGMKSTPKDYFSFLGPRPARISSLSDSIISKKHWSWASWPMRKLFMAITTPAKSTAR